MRTGWLDPRLANREYLMTVGLGLVLGHSERASSDTPRTGLFRALPDDPMAWLLHRFATYFQDVQGRPIPLASHHEEYWRWLWALRPGERHQTFIAIWSRGGGKSVSVELGAAAIGYFGLRRYGLYISSKQTQADDHVATIGHALEQLGIDRAVNRYGYSRGWSVNRLKTADDFTIDAVGMDVAVRGVRQLEMRPDIIFLDDLDDQDDTLLTIQKKIATLTQKILPTGATSLTVLGVQNIPNTHGIFAQLADGRADFLLDRYVSGPHPALYDLPATDWYHQVETPHGRLYKLHIGTPAWAGQDRADCEALLTRIGPRAFLVECQHRVSELQGDLFQRAWFRIVEEWPRQARLVRAWDFAGTELRAGADPDWTVGLLLAEMRGQFWVLDMKRIRATPKVVEDLVCQTAALDGPHVTIWLEQEGGSSGKAVVADFQQRVLCGYAVHASHPTGDKLIRAKPASSAAEAGNMALLAGAWNTTFLDELCLLGLPGVHDDIADALSLAHRALARTPLPHDLTLASSLNLTQASLPTRAAHAVMAPMVIPVDGEEEY